jgi:hypothetical protein
MLRTTGALPTAPGLMISLGKVIRIVHEWLGLCSLVTVLFLPSLAF